MKAKVKATGEIVEVEKALDAMWRDVEKNGIFEKLYYTKDLDFDLDNQHPEVTISGWVCRDEHWDENYNTDLWIGTYKPIRKAAWWGANGCSLWCLF